MRHYFHRCECGVEWTTDEAIVNKNDVVTSDEVVGVHQILKTFDGSLNDLLSNNPKC